MFHRRFPNNKKFQKVGVVQWLKRLWKDLLLWWWRTLFKSWCKPKTLSFLLSLPLLLYFCLPLHFSLFAHHDTKSQKKRRKPKNKINPMVKKLEDTKNKCKKKCRNRSSKAFKITVDINCLARCMAENGYKHRINI